LAIVGLIYASGFVVVMIHLGTYGIRDVGGELWKARDIHIGVLAFVFPTTIVATASYMVLLPILRIVGLMPAGNSGRPHVRRLTTGLILLPMELAFYCFAMLHRAGLAEPHMALSLMLFVGFLGPVVSLRLDPLESQPSKSRKRRLAFAIRLASAAWVWVWSGYVLWTYWKLLAEIATDRYRILLYLLLLFAICGSLYLAYLRYGSGHETGVWLLTAPLVGLIYYLTLMGFQRSFFSYIPASRGGGDYTVAPTVCIQLNNQGSPTSTALDKFLQKTSPQLLIDESSMMLFVADARENGGPCEWRKNPHNRPIVWAIGRERIAAIQYEIPDPNLPDPCSQKASKPKTQSGGGREGGSRFAQVCDFLTRVLKAVTGDE
jgi:hypothetical protein